MGNIRFPTLEFIRIPTIHNVGLSFCSGKVELEIIQYVSNSKWARLTNLLETPIEGGFFKFNVLHTIDSQWPEKFPEGISGSDIRRFE